MNDTTQMTPGVTISRCGACGTGYFPTRLLCPKCGANAMKPDKVTEAVVEETTVVRHNAGQQNWQPRNLATVRTADDLRLIVSLDAAADRGAKVKLFEQALAPYGRVA
jgi:uncharacterized OB-fold protein